MTAKEALTITNAAKGDHLRTVLDAIKLAAKKGRDFEVFSSEELPDEVAQKLMSDGFSVIPIMQNKERITRWSVSWSNA